MSYAVVLRARSIQATAKTLRAEAAELRAETRETRGISRLMVGALAKTRERHDETLAELGTWPYWAPASRELWEVLVAIPAAD